MRETAHGDYADGRLVGPFCPMMGPSMDAAVQMRGLGSFVKVKRGKGERFAFHGVAGQNDKMIKSKTVHPNPLVLL